MICLGIESTAHTFGVGVVDDSCKVLANERAVHVTEEGGLVPRELAEHHAANAGRVLRSAWEEGGVSWDDVDCVAFAQGPGMGPALRVGAAAARALALRHQKPLVGVNHCVAHVEIGRGVTGCVDPITVYASGANTQVIGFEKGRYRVYGETLDTGVGNVLDSFGRSLGLGFPAGPKIDEMYFQARRYIELPYSVKGMDLAFSGLLTAAEKLVGKAGDKDLAYSLMHTAFAMVAEVAERALAHTGKTELLLGGGVAASRALRGMLQGMCGDRGATLFVPPPSLCVDNGAMIAWLGLLMRQAGVETKLKESRVNQRFRTDDVEAVWRD